MMWASGGLFIEQRIRKIVFIPLFYTIIILKKYNAVFFLLQIYLSQRTIEGKEKQQIWGFGDLGL